MTDRAACLERIMEPVQALCADAGLAVVWVPELQPSERAWRVAATAAPGRARLAAS